MPSDHRTVLLGPWGGEDGTYWNYMAEGPISSISITSDANAVRSISFTSGNGDNSEQSPIFGTQMGTPEEITIDPSVEKVVLMEGIVGTYNSKETVTQLSFTTSKKGVTTKHGPFGSDQKGIEFSCLLREDPFAGFHGVCSESLISIGVMTRRGELDQWGGKGGDPWSYTTLGTISNISISYGDVIRAIRFTSVDKNGQLEHSEIFGDSDPKHKYHEIVIDTATEKLKGITGTYGSYDNMTVITSLAFTTNNRKTYGRFGRRIGTPFKYEVKEDEKIVGFHGRAGSLIDAIGVCKRPGIISRDGVLVGPVGVEEGIKWAYQPKGLISRIFITAQSTGYIFSLSFESKDEEGKLELSPIYGKESGDKYDINIDGKLNSISGTFVLLGSNRLLLTSMYFSTDKKIVYGPYGNPNKEATQHFSIPVEDGFISGFHGTISTKNGGYSLSSIGVYVNPT